MADPDSRHAIIEHLTRPGAAQPPVRDTAPRPGDLLARPVSSVVQGNPFTADRRQVVHAAQHARNADNPCCAACSLVRQKLQPAGRVGRPSHLGA